MSAFEEKIEKLVYAMGVEVEGGKTQLETLTKELDAARKESALGSGKGKGKGEDAWSKRIIDRKNFKEKVMKLEGRGGEPEMRAFSFSLRMFLSEDKSYLKLMDALEKLDDEVTDETVAELTKEFPELADMNAQLYMILCDASIPRSPAHNKLMALERRESIRGLYAYWDFSRELAGTNETSKQVVAERVRAPPVASDLADLDVRLIHWVEELKRHEALESSEGKEHKVSESMKVSTIKKMLPTELAKIVKFHKPKGYVALKLLIREEIREHKEKKLMAKEKGTGLAPFEKEQQEYSPPEAPRPRGATRTSRSFSGTTS